MATDIIARGLAVSNSGGGGGSLDVGIENGVGIAITGTDPKKISNDGVTNITESASTAADGTIKVVFGNKSGEDATKNVAVKGLKNSAFTEKTTTIADTTDAVDTKLPTEKAVRTELNKKVNSSLVGDANGIATLDATKKLTSTQLPDHNHASDKINAMTGYTKPSTTSAIDASTDTLNSAIGKLEKALDTKQASGTYATGNSAGDALKAVALNNTSAIGSTTQGVYIDANGKPQTMQYTLAQSVTANSKLTDTTYTQGNGIEISDANVIKNTGVLAVTNSPSTNPTTGEAVADGTFQVNTNGKIDYIGIKGLAASAYKGVDATVKSGSKNLVESDGVATAISTAVSTAVNALDATGASNIGASKTISAWSETDGIVSVTTQDIAINTGAVSIPQGYEKAGTASGIAVGDSVTDAFGKVEKTADGKVDKTTTVNGKALSADVTLYGNNVKLKDGTYSKDTTAKTIDKDTTVDGAVAQIEYRLDKKANGTTVSSVENTTSTVTVPACLGYAGVKMVGGKTQKVVQLVPTSTPSSTESGVVFTNNGNGSWNISSNGSTISSVVIKTIGNIDVIKSHKYLLKCNSNNIYMDIAGYTKFDVTPAVQGDNITITNCIESNYTTIELVTIDNSVINETVTPMILDLTTMYGSGNEPTIEQCRVLFADYVPYTEGTLWNGAVEKIVSTGKNLLNINDMEKGNVYEDGSLGNLDDARRSDYINVKKNSSYNVILDNVYGTTTYLVVFTSENVVTREVQFEQTGRIDFVGDESKIRVTVYKQGCGYGINGFPADFSLYIISSNFDKTTISVPNSILSLPDYGCSVPKSDGSGDLRNWIDFENGLYHHNVGSVDMGTLNFEYYTQDFSFFICSSLTTLKEKTKNMISSKYETKNPFNISESSPIDFTNLSIATYSGDYQNGVLYLRNDSYNEESLIDGKASWLNGVKLVYELADSAKEVKPISAFIPPIPCEEGGTITLVNTHSLDVPNTIVYKEAK